MITERTTRELCCIGYRNINCKTDPVHIVVKMTTTEDEVEIEAWDEQKPRLIGKISYTAQASKTMENMFKEVIPRLIDSIKYAAMG